MRLHRIDQWGIAVDDWTRWMIAAAFRPQTIERRRYYLRRLAAVYLDRSPWRLSTEDLAAWMGAQTWAPATRKMARNSLRSFYRWARTTGRIRRDPAAELPAVTPPRAKPKPVPEKVLECALRTATDRDRLILLLGAYAGLRRGEVAALRWDSITEAGHIHVDGKGGHWRVVPLHPVLAEALAQERRRRDIGGFGTGYRYIAGVNGPWVFPGQAPGQPMSAGAVGRIAANLLGGEWHSHTLRHRFATAFHRVNPDMRALQQLLGHAKLETTAGYTEITFEDLEKVVRAIE